MVQLVSSIVLAFFSSLALCAPVHARLLYGMLDSNGKTILPFEFAKIEPARRGYLLVTPLSADQKTFLAPFYVDENGVRQNEKAEYPNMLTGGGVYYNRLLLSAFGDPVKIKKDYRKKLPQSVGRVFARGDNGWAPAVFYGENANHEQPWTLGDGSKFGFVDRDGRVKLAPTFEVVSGFRKGRAIASVKSDTCIDAANKQASWGVIDESGKMIISGYSWLYGYGNSYVAAKRVGNNFDAAMWRNPGMKRIFGYDRSEEWRQFVDAYDLIGMSRKQVYELLGDPDEVPKHTRSPTLQDAPVVTLESLGKLPRINYHLWNSSCGSLGYAGVQLEFGPDDTVAGWCHTNSDQDGKNFDPWVRENVRSKRAQ